PSAARSVRSPCLMLALLAATLPRWSRSPPPHDGKKKPRTRGEPGLRVPYGGEPVMGREPHHCSHFTTFLALVLPFGNGGGLLFSEGGDAPVWPCCQLSLVGEIARRRLRGNGRAKVEGKLGTAAGLSL